VSTWHDLVTASLIGTERAVVPAVGLPGPPPAEDDGTGDPAAVLLDRAALATAARRAGRRTDRAEPLPSCEPDSRPAVSRAAANRLARILGGEYPDLLAEWLTAVIARGLRLPPQSLPALLDRARRAGAPRLPQLVAEAGGPRASWLADLNPDWKFVLADTRTGDGAWRFGRTTQRRAYLAALRARDPEAARKLIADGWAASGPQERVMFVDAMAEGLGLADEPLLQAALDDRAEEVRRRAADLLSSLVGSAFGERMAERALRCVRIAPGPSGPHLIVAPPPAGTARVNRDQVLLGVVARTPLRTWTDGFGRTAAQVIDVPSGDWAPVLFTGWARAAIAQRDSEWTAALVSRALGGRFRGTTAELEALRQLARRADAALGAPDALPGPGPDTPPAVGVALRVLRFRYEMLKELEDDDSGD
jgi:Family of unknown function (DUF5691)